MGRPARKRIHYVRAVFGSTLPPGITLQSIVTQALAKLPDCQSTEVLIAALGVAETRYRWVQTDRVQLAVGAGQPEEEMSTMGLSVKSVSDTEVGEKPPSGRAYKTADAFCTISGNEVLICVDGLRAEALARYLRLMIGKAGAPHHLQDFELKNVANLHQQQLLDRDGVKAVRLTGVLRQATLDVSDNNEVRGFIARIQEGLKAILEDDGDEKKRAELAAHYGEIQVQTIISARGGTRADQVVLDAFDAAGRELLSDAPEGVDVELVTKHGIRVKAAELNIGVDVTLMRNTGRNDLNYMVVWQALSDVEGQLRKEGLWNV